jgi:hypothetical protein
VMQIDSFALANTLPVMRFFEQMTRALPKFR